MATLPVLGSTGNCGTALTQIPLQRPNAGIRAYRRNRSKLLRINPDVEASEQVEIFEGSLQDQQLLASYVRDCRAIF